MGRPTKISTLPLTHDNEAMAIVPSSSSSRTEISSEQVTSLKGGHGPADETDANIFPEAEGLAEADIEKTSNDNHETPVVNDGSNPADFPDGGMEAWLVVLGSW